MDFGSPALNADGSLKDSSEIEWDHSPSHAEAILPAHAPSSPSPQGAIFQFQEPLGPGNINANGKWKLQEARALSSTKTVPKPPNHQNGKPGTDPKAKKTTAIDRVKSNLGLSNSVMTTQSSSRSVAATEKSNDEEGLEKKCCKKGDGG